MSEISELKAERITWLYDRIHAIEAQIYGESGELADFLTVSESADSSRTISRDDGLKLLDRLKMELLQLETDRGLFGLFSNPVRFTPHLGW